MSLAVALILIVVLVVALLSALAFVMSRARNLRPHQPDKRRWARLRARRRGNRVP